MEWFEGETFRADAAVLVLLWGEPPRVLLVRKNCSVGSYWSCDAALPGGRMREGETPEEAALREAWEEAWVHPAMVRVTGFLPVSRTRLRNITVVPVLAEPRGPLCPRPNSLEVDQVFWLPLSIVERRPEEIVHPARGIRVKGYRLVGGAVLWGVTYRILRTLKEVLVRH